jgi:hypothetical protein
VGSINQVIKSEPNRRASQRVQQQVQIKIANHRRKLLSPSPKSTFFSGMAHGRWRNSCCVTIRSRLPLYG